MGTLLRQGLQQVDTLRFRQGPVTIAAAEQAFLASVTGVPLKQLREHYGGSLLAALSASPCNQLVQLHFLKGQPQALLLVDKLAAASETGTCRAAAPAGAPLPLPITLPTSTNGSAARQPSTAPANPEVTSQLAALQLSDGVGTSNGTSRPNGAATRAPCNGSSGGPAVLLEAQLVSSAEAATVAVDALLQAGEVAVDCEGDLQRGGSISLIQLFALPAAAHGQGEQPCCYVFDLAGMPGEERKVTLRQLARLLESPDVVKVGWQGPQAGTLAGRRPSVLGRLLTCTWRLVHELPAQAPAWRACIACLQHSL